MRTCDVVGYTCEGELYCPDCAGPDAEEDDGSYWAVVFAGDELDSPENCGQCGQPIACSLTSEGVEYVRRAVREAFRRGYRENERRRPFGPSYYVGSYGGSIPLDWVYTYGIRLRSFERRMADVMTSVHVQRNPHLY